MDCYKTGDFYGWEAERVVAVTDGSSIMEIITRARMKIYIILVDPGWMTKTKSDFQLAADLGLVEIVQLSHPVDMADLNGPVDLNDPVATTGRKTKRCCIL